MVAVRSTDGGRTWNAPTEPWQAPYNQHAWNPLIPSGSSRIYSAAMEAPFDELEQPHNGPLGLRWSDDGGRTWSAPVRIRPVNDPDYKGVCHMQWCELASGTWLLGTYTISVRDGQRTDIQYVLRSEDQGQSWELLPGARPHGLNRPGQRRVLEGEIVDLGDGAVALYTRSQTGQLWMSRSVDDGRTWSELAPTELVHPDAPPMIFSLGEPGHLLALTHRTKASDPDWNGWFPDRQSLWCQISRDAGATWSEPRFLIADAAPYGGLDNAWVEVGYADVVADGDDLHIFLSYKKAAMLYLRLRMDELPSLPSEQELSADSGKREAGVVKRSNPRLVGSLLALLGACCPGVMAETIEPAKKDSPQLLAQVEIAGKAFAPDALPGGLTLDRELGVIFPGALVTLRAVGPYYPYGTIFGPRAVKAPNGDYLVFGAHGGLYFSPGVSANHAVMWRSTDQSMIWAEGVRPWQMQGSKEHCIVPFIDPSEPNRIYTMGNASPDSKFTADVVLRYSDDNGNTWTERGRWSKNDVPQKIAGFRGGPVHIRGAVLGDGTWLWGVYDRDGAGLKGDRQFVLRSEDQGMSWTLHPQEGQNGWYHPDWDKFMEGSVVATGGRNATLYLRAPGGRMYEKRTTDSGLTWSETQETPGLVHPDAPPMVFPFAGGKRLIALIHNRYTVEHPHHYHPDRTALWFAVSDDAGRSWSEPRFLIAQAKVPENNHPQIGIHPLEGSLDWNVSYADLFADGQNLHLFVGDGQRRALHLRFSENDLGRFPNKEELHTGRTVNPSHLPAVKEEHQ